MKITINLTKSEVKAIKKYLESVSPDINPKITNDDVKQEIIGIVSCGLQHGSIGDYIKETI